MSSILNLLGIGKSALLANQRALAVTGQNIANVNTPGYTRQTVVLAESRPLDARPGHLGTGVQVVEVRRELDALFERRLLESQGRVSRLETMKRTLAGLEGLFADTTDQGIGAGLNDFFGAWQDVAAAPADGAARAVLLARAGALADRFNRAAADLADVRAGLDREVGTVLSEINDRAARIADLNLRIARAEAGGQAPNDLLDARARLVNELAERVAVTTLEDEQGRLTVFVGRGRALVSGDRAYKLAGLADADDGGRLAVRYDPSGTAGGEDDDSVAITSEIGGGRLGGLLTLRDETVAGLLDTLNTLAAAVVSNVNRVHEAGYGLDGSTGKDFFDAGGTTAATMAVALTDPDRVAAASAAGRPDDGANALAVVALQAAALSSLDDLTMSGFYGKLAADFGETAARTDGDLQAQEAVHARLAAGRAEVSGVSLDEELVNLLAQQRAFEAASRVVVMADELLQTILSMKR